MTDNQFVVRVAHTLLSQNLSEEEKLLLIRLSYLKMAFPEKEECNEIYNKLMKKLYGDMVDKF